MFRDPELSIVIPVYRNAETLSTLCDRLEKALGDLWAYEVLFVHDACPENSLKVLKALVLRDDKISILDLEENVGQHQAVMTGLAFALGEKIVIMDADLQDPPESIPAMLSTLDRGFAAVFAGRRGRYESSGRLLTSRFFKFVLHLLCKAPKDAGIFVAMNAQMKDRLLACHWPLRPFVVAMIGCTQLPVTSIPVVRDSRWDGQSAYSSWGRLKSGCRAIFGVILFRCFVRHRHSFVCPGRSKLKAFLGSRFSSSAESY